MATNRYVVAMLIGLALVLASCGVQDAPNEQNANESTPTNEPASSGTVQMGSVVSVEYSGSFPNGTVFDSSEERGPLQLQVGAGQTIPGFEANLVGMDVGESKEFTLTPDQAYGEYNESLIVEQDVPIENFGNETMTDYVDEYITVTTATGQPLRALVLDVGEENVTLEIDQNHPLAGETLVFDVTVQDVSEAPSAQTPPMPPSGQTTSTS